MHLKLHQRCSEHIKEYVVHSEHRTWGSWAGICGAVASAALVSADPSCCSPAQPSRHAKRGLPPQSVNKAVLMKSVMHQRRETMTNLQARPTAMWTVPCL